MQEEKFYKTLIRPILKQISPQIKLSLPAKMRRGFLLPAPKPNTQEPQISPNTHQISISIEEQTKSLPIHTHRTQFLKAIASHNLLIINGGTHSGKSTQIPQYLHQSGYGKIISTQPSDFTAFTLANHVSKQMKVELGQEVGYSTLFENHTSDHKTVIEYITTEKLLQEILSGKDRNLKNYSVLIVDEAHKRTVSVEILLGILKNLVEVRKDLKIIISGVFPNDADELKGYFDYSQPVFQINDEVSSVEVVYTKVSAPDYITSTVSKILEIHVKELPGDILVVLPTQEEVELVEYELKRDSGNLCSEIVIYSVLVNMSSKVRRKVFEAAPVGVRKVVLVMDIVEAYLIDGIRYVVDNGKCKMKGFDPMTGSVLVFSGAICKSSAKERADLCGRRGTGKCFRLYTESAWNNVMKNNIEPEIENADLTRAVLTLKCLGFQHLICFDFMKWPPVEHLLEAVDLLYALDAVNDVGQITETGKKMAEFPLDPMLSKMIVASEKYKCSAEIITIAAMVSVGNTIFYSTVANKDNNHRAVWKFDYGNVGDDIALLRVYNSWAAAGFSTQWCRENCIHINSMKRARIIRDQLIVVLDRVKIELTSNPNDLEAITKAIASGFFLHCAKLQKNGEHKTFINPQTVFLYPSSSLPMVPPKCIIYREMVTVGRRGPALRYITEVKSEWMVEIAPLCYQFENLEVVGVKKLPRGEWNGAWY